MLLLYVLLFTLGFALVLGYWGYLMSQELKKNTLEGDFGPVTKGLEKVIQEIQLSRLSFKMDKRLTGSSIIDEPLQEVLELFFRDYVHGWYYDNISTDEGFLYDLRQTLQRALIAFANRSKDVEWVNFLTTRLVDDLTNHLKIYRKAKQRVEESEVDNAPLDIETAFFQVEHEMEKEICREQICL